MKNTSGRCGRCDGPVYHDGERWRHNSNHQTLDHCPTANLSADEALAYRLVQTALWMKRQYQDAGIMVAREYCTAKGFDVYAIEKTLRSSGQACGRSGQWNSDAVASPLSSTGGTADDE